MVWVEAVLAAVAFAALCVVVLSVAPQVAEPDDGAYHHSIVAMTMGDVLTLSSAQVNALDAKMGGPAGQVPPQWVALSNGRYISEKDPGYPFLAAGFHALQLPHGFVTSAGSAMTQTRRPTTPAAQRMTAYTQQRSCAADRRQRLVGCQCTHPQVRSASGRAFRPGQSASMLPSGQERWRPPISPAKLRSEDAYSNQEAFVVVLWKRGYSSYSRGQP
jgi:hypothetical protein